MYLLYHQGLGSSDPFRFFIDSFMTMESNSSTNLILSLDSKLFSISQMFLSSISSNTTFFINCFKLQDTKLINPMRKEDKIISSNADIPSKLLKLPNSALHGWNLPASSYVLLLSLSLRNCSKLKSWKEILTICWLWANWNNWVGKDLQFLFTTKKVFLRR